MKKKYDPLWEIVGEKVGLQKARSKGIVSCPRCQVPIELPESLKPGGRFRCGLCGSVCEAVDESSVSDDGAPQIVARLAE